jgi:hypothetical protein
VKAANLNKLNAFQMVRPMADNLQSPLYPAVKAGPGCDLTTLFGSTTAVPVAAPKKKQTLLPLLTVLFLISYGLMTVLIIEQGSTIQAQRNLIQILLGDSTQLWALKGKALHENQTAQAQAQAPTTKAPLTRGHGTSVQTPSTQTPSTQAPAKQVPADQVQASQVPATRVPQRRSSNRAGKIAKPQAELPPVPASDLSDQRRALRST